MKKIFLIIVISIVASCSMWSKKWRDPANDEDLSGDLISASLRISDSFSRQTINANNCMSEFDKLITYYAEYPKNIDLDYVKKNGQDILNSSFEARLALHSNLAVYQDDCKLKLRTLFLKMRIVEDFVGVHYYDDKQISADSIKYQDEPVPVYEPEKYRPFHLGKGINSSGKFQFKNGDIIITKGISFISSTISELATPKSLFSHIVFVHVNDKTNEVNTIESYVGKGVSLFPIEKALKNENARILVLRPKDQELASKAANYMYERVTRLKKEKKYIPYDYKLDFSDNSSLSCEEVAYDSFKTQSDGKYIIPEIESQILLDDENFLKRIGVKKGSMMVPTDMETDSRFDIVLDWTDYRVLRDSWRKDALLGEMFHWIQDYDYRIYENLTSIAAKVIWSTRYIPGLWSMMSKISGIPKDFTKDVPSITISTMASLKTIGSELLPVVTKADQDYFEKNGKWMTTEELRVVLDEYRKSDPKKLRKVFRPK